MNILQKKVQIPFELGLNNLEGLKYYFSNFENQIIRFAITDSNTETISIDYSIAEGFQYDPTKDIFNFNPRKYVNNEKFNAVYVVPTGIGVEVGGDSGDACVAAKLLGSVVDTLITHPNVVNAADFNEMTPNTLYVEGSILSRFILGTVGLSRSIGNKVLLICDTTLAGKDKVPDYILSCSINAASAARVTLGNDFDVLLLDEPPYYQCYFDETGAASGKILNIEKLINVIEKHKNDYDCFALHTIIDPEDPTISERYFTKNDLNVNPWGAIEACTTHAISTILNVPTAHAPMLADGTFSFPYGIVDPAKAPETLSKTELFCILKGLSKSPKIITDTELMKKESVLTNEDISCLIIPDRCIGLPVLAALEQGIPVIVVEDGQNLMKNNLDLLPWKDKLFRAKNYLEVVGFINCLKHGISPTNITRPLNNTKLI